MKFFYAFLIVMTIILGCKKESKQKEEPSQTSIVKKTTNEEITNTSETDRTKRLTKYKNRVDSINKLLDWKKTKSILWKSKTGDLGFKTQGGMEDVIVEVYIKYLSDGRPLAEVIHLPTFKYLGSSFYKDKNHIYTFYSMAGGGKIWIVDNADIKTFKVIGGCYAKDKNYIFGERAMKMDAVDYKTFKTCNDCGCYAKDKNGYYFWDSKIDINDITHQETLAIIEKLKKM